jgi:VWFA-related protein
VVSRRTLLSLAAAPLLKAQDPKAQDPIFSTDVKVVSLLATVRNKQGAIIHDLTKDDFTVLENGRPQTIKYFSRDTDLPLTIGLMVDTSVSQIKVVEAERGASFRFIDHILRENKDKIFIQQFDMAVMMKQALTDSRPKLEEALSLVDIPTDKQLRAGGWAPGTILYDAVVQASKETMQKQQGRKAMILMTDGVDTGSDHTLSDAIEAAQRADSLIYSIYFSAEGPTGRAVLKRMSQETGGGFFEMSKKQTFEQIFDQIQDELRAQFNIGYVSDTPVRISEFRKLQLTVNQKGLTVQSRDRYWAQR